ncbi:MAG: hypothetical protein IJP46_04165 [Prevotella sp.]|nr:hypothetical protein [Prevotella sp.]
MKRKYMTPNIKMIDVRTAAIMAGSYRLGVDTQKSGLPMNCDAPQWNDDLGDGDLEW